MKAVKSFFLLFITLLSCQTALKTNSFLEKQIEVPIYRVENRSFYAALDSFIYNESVYEYYDTSVVLYANTMDSKGTVIQLSSGGKQIYTPSVSRYFVDSTLGVFFHRSHIFLLYGRSIISEKLCINTNTRFLVNVKNDSIHSIIIDDDSYFPTTWFGKLENDQFIIMNKFPMEINK